MMAVSFSVVAFLLIYFVRTVEIPGMKRSGKTKEEGDAGEASHLPTT